MGLLTRCGFKIDFVWNPISGSVGYFWLLSWNSFLPRFFKSKFLEKNPWGQKCFLDIQPAIIEPKFECYFRNFLNLIFDFLYFFAWITVKLCAFHKKKRFQFSLVELPFGKLYFNIFADFATLSSKRYDWVPRRPVRAL